MWDLQQNVYGIYMTGEGLLGGGQDLRHNNLELRVPKPEMERFWKLSPVSGDI